VKLRDGLRVVMHISRLGNQYMQDNKPWDLLKTNKPRCNTVIGIVLNVIHVLATVAEPYMPALTKKIAEQINYPVECGCLADMSNFSLLHLPEGHSIGQPSVLFRKIEQKEMDDLRKKFGGAPISQKTVDFPLDLSVGKVTEVENHPSADHLYVLKVNTGQADRQIVSGLKGSYTADALVGKNVVVLNNIKYSNFKSVKSEGMILTAGVGKDLGVLTVDGSVAPGSRVAPRGANVVPKANFDVKGEFKKLSLVVAEGSAVCMGDLPLLAVAGHGHEPVTAEKANKGSKVQ